MSIDTKPTRQRMPQRARPATAAKAAHARWAKTPVSDDQFERLAAVAPRLNPQQVDQLCAILARPVAEAADRAVKA